MRSNSFILGIVFASLTGVFTEPIRICVVNQLQDLCRRMQTDLPTMWSCVTARDNLECARKLERNEAEVANFDSNAIYVSGRYFTGMTIATEHVEGVPHKYAGIALVKKDSNINHPRDLEGRISCHTGYARTVGWQLPIASLLSRGIMTPNCDDGELGAAQDFYADSCVPGNWSNDPIVNEELKRRFPKLCSSCNDPDSCSSKDAYAGYEGVVRCLREGTGDVAFTKVPTVKSLLERDPTLADQVDVLCLEGGRRSLPEGLTDPCTWGFRPSNAYVTSRDCFQTKGERMLTVIRETQSLYTNNPKPEWYYKVFASDSKVTSIEPVNQDRQDYRNYLGDFIYTIEKPRTGCTRALTPATYCAISEEERAKCEDFARAAASRGLEPPIKCVTSLSKVACMSLIKDGHANLLTLDGGDVYTAGRYHEMQPITAELYGGSDASYYSVAVIRSASVISSLSQLRGLRSCHTGMGRTAGWVVPIGALLSHGGLDRNECNRARSIAQYFSEGSCVPGANDTKYNPGRVESQKLCQNCIGDENGDHKCARDAKERFNGYAGAFRCLAEARGDVAFVKHTTVPQYTDGRDGSNWSRDLLSSDFQLLCSGSGGRARVNKYLDCNLAKVPSHYVMTSGSTDTETKLKLARLLADSSKYFGDTSTLFKVFKKYNDQADLIFKDSTTSLKAAPLDSTYVQVLGDDFYKANEAVDPRACNSSSS